MLKVQLKLQSHEGEHRRPHCDAETAEYKRLDQDSTAIIWTFTFKSNKEFQDFINHDRCLMLLPAQYEGLDATMIVLDNEDWDIQKLLYQDL